MSDEQAQLLKEGAAALAQSEESFRLLVEQAPDAIVVFDLDTNRFVNANPSAEKLFGYGRDELLKHDLPEFFTPSQPDGRPVAESFQEHKTRAAAGETLAFERAIRNAQGQEFICEVRVNRLPWPGRNLARASYVDITERKAAEKHLAQMESKYRGLLEAAPDAIIVFDVDLDRIVDANANAEKLFGCGRDELLKHGPQHFYPPRQPDELPVMETFRENIEHALAGETKVFERAIRNAEGKDFLCEVRLNRLPSADRKLIRASFIDIGERKRAEEALRKSEARLKLQFERMPIACITWNADFRVLSWNPAAEKIFGFTASEAMGKHPYEFIVPKDAQPDVDAIWSRLLEGDTTAHSVNENVTKDGRTIVCDWTNTPLKEADGRVIGVLAMTQDITECMQAVQALAKTNRALRTVSRGNEVLVHATSEEELLREMCRVLVDFGGYVMAWIGFAEHDEGKTVRPVAWAGHEAGFLEAAPVSWADTERGGGPTGTAIRIGEPQINQDFETNPRLALWREDALKRGYVSSMALPLSDNSGAFGALSIYAENPQAFNAEEVRLLIELADDLSYGIDALRTRAERETTTKQLRKGMEATIAALASMVELRDPYTAGHQQNVSRLAAAIARDMGLPEHDIEGIRLAGVVHDIGKINVPAEILSKPGKLTKIEFELIKAHAQAGHDIVKGVDFPWPVAQMILQHHERLDGSGYPNGLEGGAILPGAKILAVADVVEAMMARRPYREALGLEAALAEIAAGKGTRYDPAAADSCRALFREGRFSFQS